MNNGPPIFDLVGTLTRMVQSYDPRTLERFDFGSIEWGHRKVTGHGTGPGPKFRVQLLFLGYPLSAVHSCSICGAGAPCVHARALVVELTESGIAEQIEDANFAPMRFRLKKMEPKKQAPDVWKDQLKSLAGQFQYFSPPRTQPPKFPNGRELVYVIDWSPYSRNDDTVSIQLATRPLNWREWADRPKAGHGSDRLYRGFQAGVRAWGASPDAFDVELSRMASMTSGNEYVHDTGVGRSFRLSLTHQVDLLGRIARTGRLFAKFGYEFDEDMPELGWLGDEPFDLKFEIARQDGTHVRLGLCAVNAQTTIAHGQIKHLRRWLFVDSLNRLGVFRGPVANEQLGTLVTQKPIVVPVAHATDLIAETMSLPIGMAVEFVNCDDVRPQQLLSQPRGRVRIKAPYNNAETLEAHVSFDYDGVQVSADRPVAQIYDKQRHAIVQIDEAFHAAGLEFLKSIGLKNRSNVKGLSLPKKKLPTLVAQLIRADWHVEADGKLYRTGTAFDIKVASGIDWFELQGKAHFDETSIDLPRLLQALQAGQQTLVLDDGTVGVIPENWLKKFAGITNLGTTDGDTIKFGKSQVGLLDALLAEQGEVNVDRQFAAAREKLRGFDRIEPLEPPVGFIGELRPYQKIAQGWFAFLRDLGFGGCLADDMGLGKTIQVLAMLESRRQEKAGPSLIVLPRSLIFNWTAEAKKFAPQLRLLDQSHAQRKRGTEHLAEFDLVLTTYGTLRRDAAFLKDFEFDYVILDEAQAIKNASTEAAKAARLLNGKHKLALSGTPIENHLGELWSLFDFLNPGMLGRVGRFAGLAKDANIDERTMLAGAVRPFILRRTKKEVAPELPDRVEQTVVVELDEKQRKSYDELRSHYQKTLLSKIDTDGIGKSQIVILEALLRLRQAACHPGLIDKARVHEPSAKLDELLERLNSAAETGERVLVFSQFTSLLAIVKAKLKTLPIEMLYLDGKTKNRQALVEQFQTGTGPAVFLISLKAGGVGLNLTAARYVYLLDPWWNPAVEAQAIDRVHRIGQQQTVFATRLIAADTVEQKVLELQNKKRGLADAIINADNAGISSLTRDDVALLLA